MVQAMHCHPAGRRVLQATDAEDRQTVFEPFRAGEAAVGEQPVEAEVDAERAEDVCAEQTDRQPGPAE